MKASRKFILGLIAACFCMALGVILAEFIPKVAAIIALVAAAVGFVLFILGYTGHIEYEESDSNN